MAVKRVKSVETAKDRHRLKLLEYLANPENEIVGRCTLATDVLGVTPQTMYRSFNSDEMSEIEAEALDRRRARYSLKLGMVDKSLFDEAINNGNVKAIELIYKRFESWNPSSKIEINTGESFNETLTELGKRLPE